jgi:hypothetical protein
MRHPKHYIWMLGFICGLSTISYAQDRDPFSESQLMVIYQAYKAAQSGTLNQEDIKLFIEEVIKGHGIDFAPTKRVRDRLLDQGIDTMVIKSLQDEIYQHRGVELYVFDFSSSEPAFGHEFAQMIHREVEIQKPRILNFMERKMFPPEAISYDTWKANISSQYSLYITGDISKVGGATYINSVIRFRPAKTNQDLSVEISPLELQTDPNRDAAREIASWFVNSIEGVFSE